ncbi:hypothetical protein [uncultured Bradyrhizobium sp.]|jgi:hypothetical protein|uniref:hypothetical protein n=1 Tax=uncultured Bradyrhizobium sp. TaxID=199684 RepID=UPI0026222142|nr:hypothetical protein [uncultured Bradyrhizobium sp.]
MTGKMRRELENQARKAEGFGQYLVELPEAKKAVYEVAQAFVADRIAARMCTRQSSVVSSAPLLELPAHYPWDGRLVHHRTNQAGD